MLMALTIIMLVNDFGKLMKHSMPVTDTAGHDANTGNEWPAYQLR